MVVNRSFICGFAATVLLLATTFYVAAADGPVVVPCPGGCKCIPNAKAYGYFPTRWREWPGEFRPDKSFPQMIGREPLPTPAGQEMLPPPKEVIPPEPTPGAGPLPSPAPPSMGPLPEPPGAGILPPGQEIPIQPSQPPARPSEPIPTPPGSLPAMPLEPNAPLPQSPPTGGILPGLPLEPSIPIPGQTPMEPGLPGLGPQPGSPFQMEPGPSGNPAGNPGSNPAGTPPQKQSRSVPDPTSGHPGETYIISPDSRQSQAAPRHPQDGVARADWQTAARGGQGVPDYWSGVQRPSPAAQQVVYQDALAGGTPSQPPANLPPGLNGYCPVQLIENEKWVPGDPRWTVTYQGRSYLLSGPGPFDRFRANPARYCPVLSGLDPVLVLDEHRQVYGQTDYCVAYDGRLYMFSGAYSLARFRQNPKRYASVIER